MSEDTTKSNDPLQVDIGGTVEHDSARWKVVGKQASEDSKFYLYHLVDGKFRALLTASADNSGATTSAEQFVWVLSVIASENAEQEFSFATHGDLPAEFKWRGFSWLQLETVEYALTGTGSIPQRKADLVDLPELCTCGFTGYRNTELNHRRITVVSSPDVRNVWLGQVVDFRLLETSAGAGTK